MAEGERDPTSLDLNDFTYVQNFATRQCDVCGRDTTPQVRLPCPRPRMLHHCMALEHPA